MAAVLKQTQSPAGSGGDGSGWKKPEQAADLSALTGRAGMKRRNALERRGFPPAGAGHRSPSAQPPHFRHEWRKIQQIQYNIDRSGCKGENNGSSRRSAGERIVFTAADSCVRMKDVLISYAPYAQEDIHICGCGKRKT